MRANTFEGGNSPERKEKGANVEIILKFIRHGERDLDGSLTDYGRQVTKDRAQESYIKTENFDAVKAIGSTAGPKGPTGMQRALETADIYAHEIAGDEAFATRSRDALSYENLIHSVPFDWAEIYKSSLPENFSELDPQEKAMATKKAQTAVTNYLVRLDTPEAEGYKQEVAGAFAYVINHYQKMAQRLDSDSRVLMPAGTHGGMLEFLLQRAGVRKDKNGKEIKGFTDLEEIGGEFDPSEAFNVDIATDEEGNQKPLVITFDNKNRPQTEFRLDPEAIASLKEGYEKLHKLS